MNDGEGKLELELTGKRKRCNERSESAVCGEGDWN